MVRPLRIQYPGAHYYITCRVNAQEEMFLDAQYQNVFLEKLFLSLKIYNVSLLVYFCMTNHFHQKHHRVGFSIFRCLCYFQGRQIDIEVK